MATDPLVCSQCGWQRTPDIYTCLRCGFSFGSPAPAGRANLVLRTEGGPIANQQWLVSQDEVIIGRGHFADITLAHDSVSRQHARIARSGDSFLLEDLGSRNWTFVNDQRIVSPTQIGHRDRITVGDIPLTAELVREEPSAQPPAAGDNAATVMVSAHDALSAALPAVAPEQPSLATAAEVAPESFPAERPTAPIIMPPAAEAAVVEPLPAEPVPSPVSAEAEHYQQAGAGQAQSVDYYQPAAQAPALDYYQEGSEQSAPVVSYYQPTAQAAPAVDYYQPQTPAEYYQPQPLEEETEQTLPAERPDFPVGAPLSDLVRVAGSLTEHLQAWNENLSTAINLFEQAGGRQALAAFVEQIRRTQANPTDLRELVGLAQMAETGVLLLRAELFLVDLLAPLPPAGSGDGANEELEADGTHEEPVAGA